MSYKWETRINIGDVVEQDFYTSIEDTYNYVSENHCRSNYSGYISTNYASENTHNSSVTTCSSNNSTVKTSNNGSYYNDVATDADK